MTEKDGMCACTRTYVHHTNVLRVSVRVHTPKAEKRNETSWKRTRQNARAWLSLRHEITIFSKNRLFVFLSSAAQQRNLLCDAREKNRLVTRNRDFVSDNNISPVVT